MEGVKDDKHTSIITIKNIVTDEKKTIDFNWINRDKNVSVVSTKYFHCMHIALRATVKTWDKERVSE
jgi:hypothetical protein